MIHRQISAAVVTGATGAIGTALCELLLSEGITVYAMCRPNSRRIANLPDAPDLYPVFCELAEIQKLPELLAEKQSPDVFFHLAWTHITRPGRNDMDAQIRNIQYTVNACRAAKALNCRAFVGAGSQAEYGRVEGMITENTPCFPDNGYGMAKLCAEQMSRVECLRLGLEHLWARIISVYGPGDDRGTMIMSTICELLEGRKPALTKGEQRWDYLYVDDAADALYRIALSGRNEAAYPLGSGTALPLREYIQVLRDEIDPSLPLGLGEIPYGEKQVMNLRADIGSLQTDTGFAPKVDFRSGIKKTIRFVREHKNGW